MDSSAKEKEQRNAAIQAEMADVNEAIKSLNKEIDVLRNLKATEGARLEAVKARRAEYQAKLKGLEEELDGTAESRRVNAAITAAKQQVA